MRKFVRENSLGLFFGAIFLLTLVGQAVAGWKQFNDVSSPKVWARSRCRTT